MQRGVNPRVATPREKGVAGRRSAGRPDIRQQSATKAGLAGRENARQRAVERRQQAIERKQAAGKERQQLLERRQAIAKEREAVTGTTRENAGAGSKLDRTVGTRGRADALVRRAAGDRQFALRNRSFAERSARTPGNRALAQATFGGRFANHDARWRDRHHRFHRHVHVIGWLGPVFWPYAYDDFVEYTFWPYAYDTFWPYAYDDVYEGFFGPYAVGGAIYADLPAAGGGAYSRGAARTETGRSGRRGVRTAARGPAGGGAMAQICTGETSGLTDWPVERIAEVVNPNETQRAALNELRDAAARAIELMRSACPDDLPSTPVGRMEAMRKRLEAMREAVRVVRPALEKFYDSLNDEQKARFNALEQQTAGDVKARKAELSQVCSAAIAKANAVPIARIEQTLRLSSEQRAALESLNAATTKAAEILTASCPTEETLTPPGRLVAMEARLDAMLQALDIVQPALTAFYNSLSDEQKARFNQLGARQQARR